MTQRHVLVIYGTAYGQTAKSLGGSRAGSRTMASPSRCSTRRPYTVRSIPACTDGVIVGSAVLGGEHRRAVKRFVDRYHETLNRLPSAFFSVSGSAASLDPKAQADARLVMTRFLAAARWEPDLMTTLGGAFAYTKYSPWTRWLMRGIARRKGAPTDVSRDHEFTDWDHVDEFAARSRVSSHPSL